MKKFLSCVLLIMFLVSISGCGAVNKDNLQKNNADNKQEENNLQETEATATAENKESEEVTKGEVKEEPAINRKIVVIDPGHSSGGNKGMERQSPDSNIMKIKDPGGAQGISSNVPEYIVAMKVSLKLKALLEKNNITVIMTKTQDVESPGNVERAETGNNNNAALAIRIHCDSADSQSARGASMLTPAPVGYAKGISSISRKYGQTILNDLVTSAGMKNRGVVERNDLTGFNWSKVPVVLIEMGFMSNPEEDRLLNEDDYQNKLSQGLCNGIVHALQEN